MGLFAPSRKGSPPVVPGSVAPMPRVNHIKQDHRARKLRARAMKWGLSMTLATLMVAHSAHGDKLVDLMLIGGSKRFMAYKIPPQRNT